VRYVCERYIESYIDCRGSRVMYDRRKSSRVTLITVNTTLARKRGNIVAYKTVAAIHFEHIFPPPLSCEIFTTTRYSDRKRKTTPLRVPYTTDFLHSIKAYEEIGFIERSSFNRFHFCAHKNIKIHLFFFWRSVTELPSS